MTTERLTPANYPHAAALAAMTHAEVEAVSMIASTVRHELRKKHISLRSLRAIDASRPRYNPYDSGAFRMTVAVWELILKMVGTRIDDSCKALLVLEHAADHEAQRRDTPAKPVAVVDVIVADMEIARANVRAAAKGYSVGDRVKDKGRERVITMVRADGILVLDNKIETTGACVRLIRSVKTIIAHIAQTCGVSPDYAFQAYSGAEFDIDGAILAVRRAKATEPTPAADIYKKTWPEVAEAIKVERLQQYGTKPHARAVLALMIEREQRRLSPYRDEVCDLLKSHLVSCYQYGVIDQIEFILAEQVATAAERPGNLLEALRTALLRGLDIVKAMKADI